LWIFRKKQPVDPLLHLWRQETAQDQRRLQPLLAAAKLNDLAFRCVAFFQEVQEPTRPQSESRSDFEKKNSGPIKKPRRLRQFCLRLWRHQGNPLRAPATRLLRWLAVRLVTAWLRFLLCLVKLVQRLCRGPDRTSHQ
jgi:hypothetical protein